VINRHPVFIAFCQVDRSQYGVGHRFYSLSLWLSARLSFRK
jgi:hypothetical protein